MEKTSDKDKATLPLLKVVLDPDPEDPEVSLLIGTEVGEALEGVELEKIVDEDLRQFATFYKKVLGNEILSPFEKAAIKTYLWWKTHPSTTSA